MSTQQQTRRRHQVSPIRRASQYVLGAGVVLSIAAAFGPIWVVRVGVLIAVLAGVLAVRYAWTEVRQERERAGRDSVAQLRNHGQALTAERSQNREVVATLSEHNDRAARRIAELQKRIGSLRTELSSVKGDNAALKADLIERDHRIEKLSRDLATREAELRALQEMDDEAEVLAMPRHAAGADWEALPTAEDLWADGNHPTVVDLQKLAYPALEATEDKKQA